MTQLQADNRLAAATMDDDLIENPYSQVVEPEEASSAQELAALLKMPRPHRHPIKFVFWLVRCVFGIGSLILVLAVVAAIPIVNFLALGYLLEVEGRVARSGKLRDGFPLLEFAPRIGSIVMGISAWLMIVRLAADRAAVATQINPAGRGLAGLKLFAMFFAATHICLALAKGGRLRDFFPIKIALIAGPITLILGLPFGAPQIGVLVFLIAALGETLVRWVTGLYRIKQLTDAQFLKTANQHIATFVAGLRLKHHFSLGFRGFIGAFAWLCIPTALLAVASRTDVGEIVVTVFGGFCLVFVFSWMPFLQARFAAENRLKAMFELRTIRHLFRDAPWAWLLTIVITYALSLPLYLAKVQLPPSDLIWLVTIIFVVSIYPAKVMIGWAYHRAMKKQAERLQTEKKRPFWMPMACRLTMLPALGFYVFLVFFTQAIDKFGKAALFEHHAFLLPAPFFLTGG